MAKRSKQAPVETEGDPAESPTRSQELRDDRLLLALLEKPNIQTAAASAQVGVTTAFERLKDSGFTRRLKDLRRTREAHALLRLSDLAVAAVGLLAEVITDGDSAAKPGSSARVAAARAVLDFLQRERNEDVAEEIEELRAAVESLSSRLRT